MAFFDGAAAKSIGGAGVCIWTNDQHYISIRLGFGCITNTKDELLSLWELFYIVKDIGLPYLQVFSDSSVIINWTKEESTLAIVNLDSWCDNTRKLISLFTYEDFSHVYREHNKRAYSLSKEGLHMASCHLTFAEVCEGEVLGEGALQLFLRALLWTLKAFLPMSMAPF